MQEKKKLKINRHLFYDTSHSPSLIDMVGSEMLHKVIDFCFIANPYYPSKALIKKIQKQLPVVIKSYPSSNPELSQRKLANVLNVLPKHLVIGNGATELITIIEKNLIDDIAIPIPTFSEYTEKLRNKDSARLYQLRKELNYQLNLNEYADWIIKNNIGSALIINPNNPTGQLLPLHEMKEFLRRTSHLKMILVDESFIDFAEESIPSLIPFVEEFPNLMIVRSMSKHCGVPGLRLGYCCSSNEAQLQEMRSLMPIWNINTLAELFLTELKNTNDEYQDARLKVVDDIKNLYNQLKEIEGFYTYPTGTNFVMMKSECGLTATELQTILLEEYFCYVRDCSNKIGLDNLHIRVASQGAKKDKHLIRALKDISKKYK